MLLRKGFKFRVYPTLEQLRRLDAWEHALRFLWNLAHEQRRIGSARPRDERVFPTAFDQILQLTALREDLAWLADVPRNVCAQVLVELDRAWQRCFERLARAPRFKRRGRDAVGICEPHPKVWRLAGSLLRFPKLGVLRCVVHRPLQGTPKACTLVRDGDQWFASILCEVEVPDPVRVNQDVVALHRGVIDLVADSQGQRAPNPRFLRASQVRLARAQRFVARRKKGSRNREKAKLRVARLHRTVRRQRDDRLHELSTAYAKSHGKVVVEQLRIANMTRSARGTRDAPGRQVRAKAGLNRSILDSGWGRLVEMLRYKLDWAGGELVEVPAAFSSQTCSVCGCVRAENRRSRAQFECVACGHREHADVNAAKVLKKRAEETPAPVCGGLSVVGKPSKQKLRVARRGKSLVL